MKEHFPLMILFSALVSLVFSFIAKSNGRERAKYFLYLFGVFLILSMLAGWIMYPFPF